MNSIQKLTEYFSEFPGIGPRQAKRFVYYLLTRNQESLNDLTRLVADLKKDIAICQSCFRFFQDSKHNKVCSLCADSRDNSQRMIVSRDTDLDNVEKTKSFHGLYFVLGGSVPILEKNPEQRIRSKELIRIIENEAKAGNLKEIILAMNATPEGENTGEYVEQLLRPLADQYSLKISHLGKGISTGTELEYSDAGTLKNALKNRY